MDQYEEIALVITSCRRPDLLARTIQSMQPWGDSLTEKIVVEDSDKDHPLFSRLRAAGWRILVNGQQIGQHASIDRAYGSVTSRFILHCEDDWEFCAQPDFLSAKQLLSKDIAPVHKVGSVAFHASESTFLRHDGPLGEFSLRGTQYLHSHASRSRTKYHHHSFNPSLLELALWQREGPWSNFRTEGSIARLLRKRGYVRVYQTPNVCSHIGSNRHVVDRTKRRSALAAMRQWLKHGV